MSVPASVIRYLESYLVDRSRAFASLAWPSLQYAMQNNLALLPDEGNKENTACTPTSRRLFRLFSYTMDYLSHLVKIQIKQMRSPLSIVLSLLILRMLILAML